MLGSIIFYYLSSNKLILFVILSTITIYLTGLILDKYNNKIKNIKSLNISEEDKKKLKSKYKTKKKIYLFIGIIINIIYIILTKYSGFVIDNINSILNLININYSFKISKILLPLGISYYTLEAISYITDIYREKYDATKNIFKLALFLMYFPKIIEGPISRFDTMSKEFFESKKIDFNNMLIGLDLIIFGLFKKMVIADRAGIFVNNIFGNNYGGITNIMAMILYTIQIYAEFSGCIDIVRGVSLLFNVRLPINFKRPFFAKNIQEFWRLWHISLGNWIKEYVFYPISFSKLNSNVCKFCKKIFNNYFYRFICAAFPLLFVWLVNGIWHGASYKYVAYGMYYYIVMMIGLLFKPFTDKMLKKIKVNSRLLNIFQILRTFILVVIGMTLFRASSIPEFYNMIINIFKSGNGLLEFGLVKIDFIILIITNLFILLVSIFEETNKINIENGFTNNVFIRSVIYTILIVTIVVFGIYGEGYDASNFIYGAF